MKVYTIERGRAYAGARVDEFTLASGKTIPAIVIGETGRGRELGVLPVGGGIPRPCTMEKEWRKRPNSGQVCPECGLDESPSGYSHPREGQGRVREGFLTRTRTGRPKVMVAGDHDSGDHDSGDAIVVLRTHIGYRGASDLTGDRGGWKCRGMGTPEATYEPCPERGDDLTPPEQCALGHSHRMIKLLFAPFPGTIIIEGTIAQGGAGRMGSGRQHIVVVHPGAIWRTGYYGRLYGAPSAHYYHYDGRHIVSATWDQRSLGDLF